MGKNKFIILIMFFLLSFSITNNFTEKNIYANSTNNISPRSNTIIWIKKEYNGHIYKRLFNTTTNTWIGNWILDS